MIPFPTTPEQRLKLATLVPNMVAAGLDPQFVTDAAVLASVDQGFYDLFELWAEAATDPGERALIVADIREMLDDARGVRREPIWKVYETLHAKSSRHRAELARSTHCGCFHCCRVFPPSEIRSWVRSEPDETECTCAVCPYCGVDAILPDVAGPLTPRLLKRMQKQYFGLPRKGV